MSVCEWGDLVFCIIVSLTVFVLYTSIALSVRHKTNIKEDICTEFHRFCHLTYVSQCKPPCVTNFTLLKFVGFQCEINEKKKCRAEKLDMTLSIERQGECKKCLLLK